MNEGNYLVVSIHDTEISHNIEVNNFLSCPIATQ